MTTTQEKELLLLDLIKELLKKSKVVKDMFDSFDVDLESIDDMPIEFADLPVSAKTKNGKVYLNKKLLDDDGFADDIHYIVHEANHWLQQGSGEIRHKHNEDEEYLDLPTEMEAFKNQLCYIRESKGNEEAKKYLDMLLEFHNYSGEAKKRKERELMGD